MIFETDLRALLTIEPLQHRVQRLRCFRGIDDLTALTIAAELGDARRFPTAPSTMAFVGLVPSEHSSGAKRAQGAITKTGMPICGGCWSNPLGTIAIIHLSVPPCGRDSAGRRRRSLRRPGRHSNASTVGISASRRGANRNSTS